MDKKDILVFSIALEGYSTLFKKCLISQQEYCSKYGFSYTLVNTAPKRLTSGEAAWLKLFLLRSALLKGYEWVAFLDADCEVRNHTPSFVEEMGKWDDKGIFMAEGFSGRINSGVIFVKNIKDSLDFLETVIKNGDSPVPKEDRAPHENGHMIHYGKNNNSVALIEAFKWNNNRDLNKESFIQHYSGGKLRKIYLKSHPLLKILHLWKRATRRLNNVLTSKPYGVKMKDVNSLMSFYRKIYPHFTKNSS